MEENKGEFINGSQMRERKTGRERMWYSVIVEYYYNHKQGFKNLGTTLASVLAVLLFFVFILYGSTLVQELTYGCTRHRNVGPHTVADSSAMLSEQKKLISDIRNLEKRLERKIPRSTYLVVNTSKNKFALFNNKMLIGKGRCSTGSYILLSNGDQQQWIFKTPKGVFDIKGKKTNPVWIKPDWAFVEEGLPIPSETHSTRYEYGVLGDYALSLGHGYMIHGTLYQRFLGLPVTHGCIRLNDEDLYLVYHRLSVGSKVFIY